MSHLRKYFILANKLDQKLVFLNNLAKGRVLIMLQIWGRMERFANAKDIKRQTPKTVYR